MLDGPHGLATRVGLQMRRLRLHQQLAGQRMLPLREPGELLLADLAGEPPRGRQAAIPLATNLVPLGVVVLARVAELLRVIALRLPGAERLRHRHHGCIPFCRQSKLRWLCAAPCPPCEAAVGDSANSWTGGATAGAGAGVERNRGVPADAESARAISAWCRLAT